MKHEYINNIMRRIVFAGRVRCKVADYVLEDVCFRKSWCRNIKNGKRTIVGVFISNCGLVRMWKTWESEPETGWCFWIRGSRRRWINRLYFDAPCSHIYHLRLQLQWNQIRAKNFHPNSDEMFVRNVWFQCLRLFGRISSVGEKSC